MPPRWAVSGQLGGVGDGAAVDVKCAIAAPAVVPFEPAGRPGHGRYVVDSGDGWFEVVWDGMHVGHYRGQAAAERAYAEASRRPRLPTAADPRLVVDLRR